MAVTVLGLNCVYYSPSAFYSRTVFTVLCALSLRRSLCFEPACDPANKNMNSCVGTNHGIEISKIALILLLCIFCQVYLHCSTCFILGIVSCLQLKNFHYKAYLPFSYNTNSIVFSREHIFFYYGNFSGSSH